MADLINILRCTYRGPGEGVTDEIHVWAGNYGMQAIPYSRIMINGNDVTNTIESTDGGVYVSGLTVVVDFYLTGDTIGAKAFYSNTTSLLSVNVPSIVKKLGSYTFAGNGYLRDVVLNEGLEDIGFNEAGEEYTGRTFENIGPANIIIPSTVRHIGQNSFYGFGYGQTILFLSETPPTIDDNGEGTFGQSGAKFLVPRGTVEAYKQALGNDWGYADSVYEFDPNVTNKTIVNAYVGENGALKIYLGTTLVYSCATCSQIGMCGGVPNCRPCTCADEGRCGDYPDCHDCTCEEQYEEGTEDYCNCRGGFWDGSECHTDWNCTDNWEDMGYTSEYDCNCSRYGDCHTCEEYGECGDYPDCYACEPEDPCAGMEQEYEDCINGGGVWDAGTCTCQPSDPCVEDPCSCAEPGSEEECNCQGGTWDGENCNFE